jgi:hypothetical protein
MRLLTIALLLTLASCRGFSGVPTNLIDDPRLQYCPVGSFAYCENDVNCECIDRRLQRALFQRLR